MQDVGLQIVTLVLAGFYCVVVNAFRISDSDNRPLRERFVRLGLVLAALTVGLAMAKGFLRMQMQTIDIQPIVVIMIAAVAAIVIVALQMVAIRSTGAITLQKELAMALVENKRNTLAMWALTSTPVILLFTGANPVRDEVLVYLAGAEIVALFFVFVVRTFKLFVRQKVSVLVWFLYLCSVEVVPACAVVALVVKSV